MNAATEIRIHLILDSRSMPLLSAGWPALCPCRFGGDRVTKRARQASPRRAPLQSAMIAVDQAMLAAGNLCRSGNFVCRVLRVARIMETFQPSSQGHRRIDYGATRAQPPRRCCLPVEHARLSSFPSLLGLVSFAEKPALVKQPQRLIPGFVARSDSRCWPPQVIPQAKLQLPQMLPHGSPRKMGG